MTAETDRPGGAYGLAIAGVPQARSLLVDAPPQWPRVELSVSRFRGSQPAGEGVETDSAVLRLRSGGWVEINRGTRRAIFTLPSTPSDAALVHPHLASVASVYAHWSGHESFHAGGFVAGDGVWGLLGDRGAGKSSMLASLALRGVQVFCDDVLVVDGQTAFAGPRSIDLRAGAARRLECGEALGVVGGRNRWRLSLAQVSPELPFRGWIELRWDSEIGVRAKTGAERLRTLLPHRGLRVAPNRPEQLVHLAGRPVLELRRPADWSLHQRAVDELLRAVRPAGEPGDLEQGE